MNGVTGKKKVPVHMSDEEFCLIRDLIEREFGFVIKGDKRLTLHTKIAHRLDILGIASYGDYYNYVVSDPSRDELLNLIAHITNNETFFLRETMQYKVLTTILGEIKRNKQRANESKITVVSAGCSTGEEAYNLSLTIMESGLFLWGWEVNLFGIDVSRLALRKAEAAEYTRNSFRMFEGNEEFVRKYFEQSDGKYLLKKSYQRNVRFRQGNITKPGVFEGIDRADVIFCRNVLIYMSDAALQRIVANFFNHLSPEGYLFIGSSESLLQKTDLLVPEFKDGIIVYRRNPLMASEERRESVGVPA